MRGHQRSWRSPSRGQDTPTGSRRATATDPARTKDQGPVRRPPVLMIAKLGQGLSCQQVARDLAGAERWVRVGHHPGRGVLLGRQRSLSCWSPVGQPRRQGPCPLSSESLLFSGCRGGRCRIRTCDPCRVNRLKVVGRPTPPLSSPHNHWRSRGSPAPTFGTIWHHFSRAWVQIGSNV